MTITMDGLATRRAGTASEAWSDIGKGASLWRLWTALAWHFLRQRYKRTWIGISWIGVSFGLFMAAKIFVFGAVMADDIGFYAGHLTLGYLIFRVITNAVTGSSSVFVSAYTWISSEPLPLSLHVYKMMMNNFIIFAITSIPAAAICIWAGAYTWLGLFWIIPSVAIYAIATVAVGLLLGVFSARYRDIMHFSTTVMSIAYFLTPVLWVAPEEGLRAKAALINPFTHYIAIMREPLLYGTVPLLSWMVVLACTAVLILLAFAFFSISRRKIIFWL